MSRVFNGCRVLMAAAAARGSAAAAASTATKTSAKPHKPRSQSGILKPIPVSPALRKFVGLPEVSRADAVKKIWDYIKRNNLQNPANKKEIYCDEKLKALFDGKESVGFLEIARLLSRHFVKTG
ncbi:hypothetical protein Syun_030082 [Stephania yunnanensis]|uniref:DM2 domain-containing protein n=1 Tax=Stephania yunnanensis TaxID=152371 RepID=A0AAP0HGN1_9MAGN